MMRYIVIAVLPFFLLACDAFSVFEEVEKAAIGGIEISVDSAVIVNGSTVDFGTTVGPTLDKIFSIKNIGNQTISIDTFSITANTCGNGFSVLAAPQSTLAVGESTTATIRFDTCNSGGITRTATLNISGGTETYTLTLSVFDNEAA